MIETSVCFEADPEANGHNDEQVRVLTEAVRGDSALQSIPRIRITHEIMANIVRLHYIIVPIDPRFLDAPPAPLGHQDFHVGRPIGLEEVLAFIRSEFELVDHYSQRL